MANTPACTKHKEYSSENGVFSIDYVPDASIYGLFKLVMKIFEIKDVTTTTTCTIRFPPFYTSDSLSLSPCLYFQIKNSLISNCEREPTNSVENNLISKV